MLHKKQVLEMMKCLPDTFPAEELIDRITLLQKIKKGEEDIKAGRCLSTEEAKLRLKKWL